jgi:hypothetical protein
METTKKWYTSKTIWGIAIAAIGFIMTSVFGVQGISIPQNGDFDQLKAYADAIQAAQGNTGVIIGQVMGAVGTVLAIIGRVKAEQKIAL